MAYRWILRKGSRKEVCPCCGQKRFVPYVLAADGVTLAGEEYGRCDRQDNCGYSRYPTGKKADTDIKPQPVRVLEPLRFYPAAVQIDYGTPLFDYTCKLVGFANAVDAWKRYKVGRDNARTVFWQIDVNGEIRAGKSIPYKLDGHRDKTDKYPANWLHKVAYWRAYWNGEELQQCFFGEHLLKDSDKPVAVVESEKTALIMSVYSKGFVWLACGGAQNLKNEQKNAVLKGRDVLLIPDNGQYWNWKPIADANGWEITTIIETCPCFEGCDILDMLEAGFFGDELLKYKRRYENK